ncbi:YqcC family protein [Marinospirillum insulare]|uniref:YqcC-like domain-containing protein n=1 Tax=Marinospirillum insulare TaxID=217169 RepID=A0ABQ5ZT44_9GAMM|nr:YqcC family protein [Marinospirillum insulare]GLR63310.1 hypothetical protein GCM10007878_07450 [Marinospirillum insulare]
MTPNAKLLNKLLNLLEKRLKHINAWQVAQPDPAAFNSQTPFCVDTMSLEQWLRYIFIPRMQALIDAGKQLPTHCAITEQVEMVLSNNEKARVMEVTLAIDKLLTEQKIPSASLLKQV